MAMRPASLTARPAGKARKWATTSRLSRHARGYGTEWDKTRARILKRDRHLCQTCRRADRVTVATEVDHRTPKALGGTDDDGNLEAICSPCHKAKTAREGHARRV